MDKVKYTICLMFVIRTAFCQSNNTCLTPSEDSGNCINLKRCPRLRFLLENQRDNSTVVTYLRNSLCGYEGKDVKVCCPLENEPYTSTEYAPTERIASQTTVNSSKLPAISMCGKTNISHNRIVGGRSSDLGDWPWMTALGYRDLNSLSSREYQWLCGGSLISDKYIITAAHCTVNIGNRKLAIARLGDLNLDNNVQDGASPIDVPVAHVFTHELYNAKLYVNDIALIQLNNTVNFNKFIQPICLPILPEYKTNSFVNLEPFVTGWGATAYKGPSTTALMEIQIPVVSNADCKKAFASKPITIDERVLCAGILAGGKDACQGDSGGPLMMPGRSQQFYLIGVVSYGQKCAEPGFPGVYTRVTSFVEWIAENMNKS